MPSNPNDVDPDFIDPALEFHDQFAGEEDSTQFAPDSFLEADVATIDSDDSSERGIDGTIGKPKESQKNTKVLQLTSTQRCLIIGIAGAVQGFGAGTMVGIFHSLLEGIPAGIHKKHGFGSYLMKRGYESGRNFGGWTALYLGSKCVAQDIRKKRDVYNSFLGGFAAGSVMSLHTRSIPTAVMAGLASGTFMTVVEVVMAPKNNG